MEWLTASWSDVAVVVAKGVLMYATALICLRFAERRTLAQWTIIDVAAAVAVGAVVGRTIVAEQSYAVGALALVTLVSMHRLASLLRFRPVLGKLADHRIRVLVADGELRPDQLRLCGLTDNDIYAELRRRGVFDLAGISLVPYETKGDLTVVGSAPGSLPPLIRAGLADAVDLPDRLRPARDDGTTSVPTPATNAAQTSGERLGRRRDLGGTTWLRLRGRPSARSDQVLRCRAAQSGRRLERFLSRTATMIIRKLAARSA